MCGRFTLRLDPQALSQRLHLEIPQNIGDQNNISPSQLIPTLPNFDPEQIVLMKWGLTPIWWKEPGRSLINIRAETLKEKRTFSKEFKQQRCIILTDGFYEWDKHVKPSQPYLFQLKPPQLFAFAGLWSKEKDGYACALITTEANDLVGKIHDRMPVILRMEETNLWLDEKTPLETLQAMLKPFSSKEMEVGKVDRKNTTSKKKSI